MPRANDNRKPVGTQPCAVCGTLARFFQVQRGNRLGYLYRRCDCGANQTSGAAIQIQWLNEMQRTNEPMIPHPLQGVTVPDEPASEPEGEPDKPAPKPATPSAGRGVLGFLILGVAAAVALIG